MTIAWKPRLKQGGEPLYLSIVENLKADIKLGRLRLGTRLPTHRELANDLGVAIGTITRAYNEAEQQGLVYADGRRGTFVGGSAKARSFLSTVFDSESQLIDLSKNHPTYSEDPDLGAALRQLGQRSEVQELLRYPNPQGMLRHRVVGADWIGRMGLQVDPDSIIVTAGAQHALTVVFSVIAKRGDVVLVEDHTYPGIKAIAEVFDLQLVGVPIDGEGLLPDAIESICRQRHVRAVYCVPTIQNPTNAVMLESRRREIAALAQQYGFEIVEDEINRRLTTDPPPPISQLAADRGYFITSVSKTIAAGLRVGFLTAPSRSRQILIDALAASTLAVSPLPVEILTNWIEDGTAEKTIERRRQESQLRQQLAVEMFRGYRLGTYPTSYYVWLHLPDRWTTMEFTREAYRRGIAITPAETFAIDRNAFRNAVRVSLSAAVDRVTLKGALEILRSMLDGFPRHDSTAV